MKTIFLIISYLIGVYIFCYFMYEDAIRTLLGFIVIPFSDSDLFAVYTIPSILSALIILFINWIINGKLDIKYSIYVWVGLVISLILAYFFDPYASNPRCLWCKINLLYRSLDNIPIMVSCLLFAVSQGLAISIYIIKLKRKLHLN